MTVSTSKTGSPPRCVFRSFLASSVPGPFICKLSSPSFQKSDSNPQYSRSIPNTFNGSPPRAQSINARIEHAYRETQETQKDEERRRMHDTTPLKRSRTLLETDFTIVPSPTENGGSSAKKPRSNIEPSQSPCDVLGSRLSPVRAQNRSSSAPETRALAPCDDHHSLYSKNPERSLPVPDQHIGLGTQGELLDFYKRNESRTIIENTYSVFDLMKENIVKSNFNDGWIYILRSATNPHLLKIGSTSKTARERKIRITHCIGTELKVLDVENLFRTPNHFRVEKLIHRELYNFEKKLNCKTCKKAHKEWFEVSEEKAVEVVERWKRWMSTDPYSNGQLSHPEVLRIDSCAKNAAVMRGMISPDGQSWRWDDFMATPPFYFKYLRLSAFLFAKRFTGKSDHSRWESLLCHWKSNLAFMVIGYTGSVLLSLWSYYFPDLATSIFTANVMLLVIEAIIYAA